MMTIEDAVDLVLYAFKHGNPATSLCRRRRRQRSAPWPRPVKLSGCENEIRVIGTRHGEKLYETLLNREEMAQAEDLGGYYRVPADVRDLNYSSFFSDGDGGFARRGLQLAQRELLNVERDDESAPEARHACRMRWPARRCWHEAHFDHRRRGFLGRNLIAHLRERPGLAVRCFDRGDTLASSSLKRWSKRMLSFIWRVSTGPRIPLEFETGNVALTAQICNVLQPSRARAGNRICLFRPGRTRQSLRHQQG